jgi:hypothetical protein
MYVTYTTVVIVEDCLAVVVGLTGADVVFGAVVLTTTGGGAGAVVTCWLQPA